MDFIEKFRGHRSKKLEKIGTLLVKTGITANHLTALSFLSGLLTIYFLFVEYYLFVLFALLHLLFDAFDGVLARLTKPTTAGKYVDLISDSLVTVLALVKVGWFLQEFYAYIAAGLFLGALAVHLLSKLSAPIFFMRTATLLVLIIATNPAFPFTKILLTVGYLTAGGVSLFSLAKQLQWFTGKK